MTTDAQPGNLPDTISMTPPQKKTTWAWTTATFFGVGFGKPGPGTWGSVAAFLFWAAEAYFR